MTQRILTLWVTLFIVLSSQSCLAAPTVHTPTAPPLEKSPPLVYQDADHVQHALSDFRGRLVLLNIWATWCGPCVKEMPSLEALQKSFPTQQLVVLPLSEDRGDGTVSAFYQRHRLTHLPVAIDHGGVAPEALKIEGLPTTFLINADGQIIARFDGSTDWDSPDALNVIRAALRTN
jgi:thiol-disulfide isomerase/thioredoxin